MIDLARQLEDARIRRRGCDGKRHYATEKAAEDLLATHKGNRKRIKWLGVYGCRFCGAWHIGHDRKRKVAKR